ncbi:hypothetical protein LCP9604111_609 [Penicillium roqueforti]|uniref:uncharacterized protein n=1 Tax=Penicillium roqueforti TaxID=5082 RepID=UPI0019096BF2|nr:uncharacterized protein LCP9604111_609 [Penicillium roqueforti]KAF9253083.1 hypothetical protein LCP9604111_609 [Penicillium roqueforti]KAI2723546.1 hypothetical protein CBS147318_477 [Penicillium roqueforti]KAI3143062.1 hypothetical protein CBS147330_849 [Penicillium roqueforti]KAI3177808.1 hypothetical protein DTO039G3_1167 [Penicillium roqueforti]KAI3241327.1 hypothetical protein CBS147310_674 [Penicillium roqueforti]
MQTTVFDKACALELLEFANPFLEEKGLSSHSWAKMPNPACSAPLLRVWDKNSGSHPDQSNRMLARLPRQRLGSRESREKSLATHAAYQIWEPTPFISFTASVLGLQRFLSRRKGPRFPRTLTVINPNVRIANGLPILEMESELRYYEVQDPYRRAYSFYKDEYLCLWEVTPDEVVAHWDWDDLIEDVHWYEDKILPAFKEHNDRFLRRSQIETTFDMSTLQSALPGMFSFSVNRDELSGSDLDHSPEADSFPNENWSFSSEEENWQVEDDTYWDTDDEVEESNAIDDSYKILEGDW